MLLNQEKADSRSFLEPFQGKRNDESSLAASAPMHDYETISLVFSGVKRLPAQPPPTPPPLKRILALLVKSEPVEIWFFL